MAQERVEGRDDPPVAMLNMADAGGRYRVTADGGVFVAAGHFAKGAELSLSRDEAVALGRDHSVEKVEGRR